MADQPGIAEQRLKCLVRHRADPARLETIEDLFEGRPFRVDQAVLRPARKILSDICDR